MVIDSEALVEGRHLPTFSPPARASASSPRTNQRNANEHMLNEEAATILHPSIATSHEALHLLSVAAGQTAEANRQSSQSLPSHLRSPSTTFGTPNSVVASHSRTLSYDMASNERISGEPARLGVTADPTLDPVGNTSYQEAFQMWSRMRLVKAGWFTATEAMAYVD